jgi:hypothetical protein
MLPIDMQAEIIRSFQEEKRQRLMEMRQREQAIAKRPSWRARTLRASGNVLIAAGRNLQRLAGGPITVELERRPMGKTV